MVIGDITQLLTYAANFFLLVFGQGRSVIGV